LQNIVTVICHFERNNIVRSRTMLWSRETCFFALVGNNSRFLDYVPSSAERMTELRSE